MSFFRRFLRSNYMLGGGDTHRPCERIPLEVPLIRPATPEDSAAVIDLVIAAEMFSAEDAWLVEGMLSDYFDAKKEDGHI